ncbi:MAG: hypothetical protein JSV14_16510 [Deltaproteobacteria bacterium]|nr:MAG: hypothetical protein JSV14_16510 [Deltaproteobacteria bacterium]
MGKLSRKKSSVDKNAELDIRAENIEDEIVDLVDPVEETAPAPDGLPTGRKDSAGAFDAEPPDENLETIETTLDLFLVEGEELDDTLDEDLMGGNIGDSNETLIKKSDAGLDFEASLVELFESSESLAAELLEESPQTEEEEKESLGVGKDPSDEGNANLGLAAEASDQTGGTGEILESEDELPDNLFISLEPVKEAPSKPHDVTAIDGKPEVTSDKTNWIGSSRYYPLAVHAIDRKIAEYEQEIEKLVAEKEQVTKTYVPLRSILYLEGEALRKAVMLIFAKYWSLKLFFLHETKGAEFNENILIKYDSRKILAKIKSTSSASSTHKSITQMWQDLRYSGLGARADGALIVNYDRETDPKDRGLAYADDDEDQLDDLIFIDTRVLYKLTAAIIDGHLSVEEAKKILFKKGRVEFYSADLAF